MTTTITAPGRIRRRREKGWTMPEGAVYVGRGSKWGNPFKLNDKTTGLCRYPAALETGAPWEFEGRISADGMSHAYFHPDPAPGVRGPVTYCEVRYMTRAEVVELYGRCLSGDVPPAVVAAYGRRNPVEVTIDDVRAELAGKTLACWCHVDDECHADVLLKIANAPMVCKHCDLELYDADDDSGWTTVLARGEGGTGAYCGLSKNHNHTPGVAL